MYTQTVKEDIKIDTQSFLFSTGILVVLAMVMSLVFFWKQLPPELPWLFSLPWGDKQLLAKNYFAASLAGLTALLFITKYISHWSGKKDEIVKTTIMTGGLIMVLLYAASFFKVLSIFLL